MEIVATIVDYGSIFLQMLLQSAIILNIVDIKYTRKRLLATIAVAFLLYISAKSLTTNMILTTTIWIVLFTLCYKIAYKQSLRRSLVLGVFHNILSTCIEYILLLLISLLPQAARLFLDDYRMIPQIFIICVYLTLHQLSLRMNIDIFNLRAGSGSPRVWIVYLLFIVLFTDPYIIQTETDNPFVHSRVEIYNIVLLIIFFVYNIIYVRSIQKNSSITQQLDVQTLYSNSLEKTVNQFRGFKHDFANIIMTIGGYIEFEDWDSLKTYMDDLDLEFLKINTADFINSNLKSVPILYGVVLSAMSTAERNGIRFEIDIREDINAQYLSLLDFSRLVGILLDNALEAATGKCPDSFVKLRIYTYNGRTIVEITNSIQEPVDTSKIFEPGYTTKEGHQGFGLGQVKEIARKYRRQGYDTDLQTINGDMHFLQKLSI